MRLFIIAFILMGLSACKKPEPPQPKPLTTITYSFYSESTPYFIWIGDITNLHDFSDSIFTPSYSKTIVYEYNEKVNCAIEANSVGVKTITINKGGDIRNCEDTLYKSLNCFFGI